MTCLIGAQDYITRTLLEPLGMSSSRWDAGAVPAEHKAHGYGRKGSAMPSSGLAHYEDDAPHEEPVLADGAWAPLGGLWTTPRDYARGVAFQLAAWPPRDDPDPGPVRRASLREAQEAHTAVPVTAQRDEKGVLNASARGYGFGRGVQSTCNFDRLVAHGGGLPGYGSYVVLLPSQGVAFFSMTNLTYTSGATVVLELIKGLRVQGLLPERPVALSPQLQQTRASVLELLSTWNAARAMALFDAQYASYRTPEKQRAEFEALHKTHGECRPSPEVEPENGLRGRMRLSCDRGAIAMTAELTSDVPARIQALVLDPILPPTPQLGQVAGRTASILGRWSDDTAAELFASRDDLKKVQRAFARATANHGACRLADSVRGDGARSATFRLTCEHGDLDLQLKLAANGRVESADISELHGGPRCVR